MNPFIRIILLALCCWFSGLSLHAQTTENRQKYWIFLKDKGNVTSFKKQEILSPKALKRRAKQGISLSYADYPVNKDYLSQIRAISDHQIAALKWQNLAVFDLTEAEAAAIRQLPFVNSTRRVQKLKRNYEPTAPQKTTFFPSQSIDQYEMLGMGDLHANGYTGTGITIAVFDNGFRNVDTSYAFTHLHTNNRILATWDFVHEEADVYDQGNHGAWVLSFIAGYYQGSYQGTAPNAQYILCQTEDDANEGLAEEINWMKAAEFADSLGADIITTSLGYSDGFTDSTGGYVPADMDGNTTLITRQADLAVKLGILVINSAGNEGNSLWRIVSAPADGDSVLTVGSVAADSSLSSFSSRGPTADGRMKPDICGMGSGATFVGHDGALYIGNGTSFSCPIIAGFAACLLQVQPDRSPMEMVSFIKSSGDRADNPDNDYGWGIPSAHRAYQLMTGSSLPQGVYEEGLGSYVIRIWPNPANDYINIGIENEDTPVVAEITLTEPSGRRVFVGEFPLEPFYNRLHLEKSDLDHPRPGLYIMQVNVPATGFSGVSSVIFQQ